MVLRTRRRYWVYPTQILRQHQVVVDEIIENPDQSNRRMAWSLGFTTQR